MQWASSMATRVTVVCLSTSMNSGEVRRSGVQNTISQVPPLIDARAWCSSSAFRLLLTWQARTPSSSSFSSWSFMSEISGETTTVVPPSMRAGIW